MYGFKSVNEMAEKASVVNVFDKIKVPMFALTAKDDSFFTDEFVPKKRAQCEDSNVLIACSDNGMHCCHLSGWLIPTFWSPVPIMEWLNFLELK